jgi:glycosyltransferase involved in cell wall biosynthesis
VQRAARHDQRIRLLDGAAEPGTYAARNLGVAAAQGAFITVLDADDWAHPARIARQLRALQHRPAAAASFSHWVRVTPDLRFTRWWGDAGHLHPDVSSLMIRAELRDSLGYWDRARAGADSEYMRRIVAQHGAGAMIAVLPGLPLSFGRTSATSLTGAAETSIASQHFGPRRSYDEAGARWHKGLMPDNLPLPRHPMRRPFAIPAALAIGDPDPVPTPEDRILASGAFNPRWYLQTYPDLRAQRLDPAAHYLTLGAEEGRDPGPQFSTSGYAMTHDCAGQNPLLHALEAGQPPPLPDWPGDLALTGPHHLYAGHQARAALFGAERSLLDRLARAVAAGITPSVVLPHLMNPAYLAALRPLCHRIHIIPYGWRFGAVPPPPETVALLADLITRTGAVALHQNTAVLAAPLAAARAAGVPGVLHVHELPAEDAQLCHEMGLPAWEWRAQLLEEADHFIANSAAVVDWLDVPPARVDLLPNRIDPALFDMDPPDFTQPLRAPLNVALIGSLTRRKGLGDMLTLARAATDLPLRFVLIGPQNPDLAALGPLPPNLTHPGYAPGPMAAMARADIVLCLSHFAESYGLSVMEAMAAGRPVISYDRGTPPSLIGPDGIAGHITPQGDPGAVLAALRRMLADPAILPAMSHAARARARSLHG